MFTRVGISVQLARDSEEMEIGFIVPGDHFASIFRLHREDAGWLASQIADCLQRDGRTDLEAIWRLIPQGRADYTPRRKRLMAGSRSKRKAQAD